MSKEVDNSVDKAKKEERLERKVKSGLNKLFEKVNLNDQFDKILFYNNSKSYKEYKEELIY